MASVTQLQLYNGACRMVGEARLQTLSDNREARYLLDDVWADGAVDMCLEQGLWYFAMRTSMLTADTSLTPLFGYKYVFEIPTDWIKTAGVCQDEMFNVPLTQYADEAGYLFANVSTVYFRYISNDPAYGTNMNRWPETFQAAVQGYLASNIVTKLTAGAKEKILGVARAANKLMVDARSKAAMVEGAKFLPMGSWSAARFGSRSSWDRGNRSSLYG